MSNIKDEESLLGCENYMRGRAVPLTSVSLSPLSFTTIANGLWGKEEEENLHCLKRKRPQPPGNRQGPFPHAISKDQYFAGPKLLQTL